MNAAILFQLKQFFSKIWMPSLVTAMIVSTFFIKFIGFQGLAVAVETFTFFWLPMIMTVISLRIRTKNLSEFGLLPFSRMQVAFLRISVRIALFVFLGSLMIFSQLHEPNSQSDPQVVLGAITFAWALLSFYEVLGDLWPKHWARNFTYALLTLTALCWFKEFQIIFREMIAQKAAGSEGSAIKPNWHEFFELNHQIYQISAVALVLLTIAGLWSYGRRAQTVER